MECKSAAKDKQDVLEDQTSEKWRQREDEVSTWNNFQILLRTRCGETHGERKFLLSGKQGGSEGGKGRDDNEGGPSNLEGFFRKLRASPSLTGENAH